MRRLKDIQNVFRIPLTVLALGLAQWSFGADVILEDKGSITENNNTAFNELDLGPQLVLTFESGSSKVSADQEAELKALLHPSDEHLRIKEVVVAAYSDKPFPKDADTNLETDDRDLAMHRGYMVQRKLEQFGARNVHVINMATRAHWFDKTFMTRNGQIKRMLTSESFDPEVDNPFYRSVAAKLRIDGAPGVVVIAVRIAQ